MPRSAESIPDIEDIRKLGKRLPDGTTVHEELPPLKPGYHPSDIVTDKDGVSWLILNCYEGGHYKSRILNL